MQLVLIVFLLPGTILLPSESSLRDLKYEGAVWYTPWLYMCVLLVLSCKTHLPDWSESSQISIHGPPVTSSHYDEPMGGSGFNLAGRPCRESPGDMAKTFSGHFFSTLCWWWWCCVSDAFAVVSLVGLYPGPFISILVLYCSLFWWIPDCCTWQKGQRSEPSALPVCLSTERNNLSIISFHLAAVRLFYGSCCSPIPKIPQNTPNTLCGGFGFSSTGSTTDLERITYVVSPESQFVKLWVGGMTKIFMISSNYLKYHGHNMYKKM